MRSDSTKLTKQLGKKLAAIRADAGVSQEKFAKKVGITRGYLSDIERGEREVSLATLNTVCRRLRTTPNALLGY